MNPLIKIFGRWWLGGAKYALSKMLAGDTWNEHATEALARYGIDLSKAKTLDEVVAVFRPRWRWRPDALAQAWDTVLPPQLLLLDGGEDCDGWAMMHAQAIEEALGPLGWEARIVSYLADPWKVSHHFAVAIDPDGILWAVQPQPAKQQPDDLDPIVHLKFQGFQQAAETVASFYQAKVVWFDVRMPDYRPAHH